MSPVEVKSGVNLTHSSIDKFAVKFRDCLAERFLLFDKDVRIKDGITHLPFYMAPLLVGRNVSVRGERGSEEE